MLGAGEFVIVYVLGRILEVPLEPVEAIVFYWVAWTMAVWTRIVILPIVSLTWIESGGEFRRTGWSHPAEHGAAAGVAALQDRPVGEGGLCASSPRCTRSRRSSPNLPAPSGVHQVPRQPALGAPQVRPALRVAPPRNSGSVIGSWPVEARDGVGDDVEVAVRDRGVGGDPALDLPVRGAAGRADARASSSSRST